MNDVHLYGCSYWQDYGDWIAKKDLVAYIAPDSYFSYGISQQDCIYIGDHSEDMEGEFDHTFSTAYYLGGFFYGKF